MDRILFRAFILLIVIAVFVGLWWISGLPAGLFWTTAIIMALGWSLYSWIFFGRVLGFGGDDW